MPSHTGADRPFGARLRQLRLARGLSLRGLAELVPCTHPHIANLEGGSRSPSPELAARLDKVLGSGGELQELLAAGPAAAPLAWQPRLESFGRRDAEALADALTAEAPTAANALRLAHEWLVAEPPQVYEIRAGRRIGAGTVAKVEQRVRQLRLMDDHIGGTDSYAVVTGELSATSSLLREAAYPEHVGRRLLVAIGELAQLAGWVASDAGRHRDAEHLYLTGASAAHAGGDIAGAANNLSSLAYQTANLGDPRDAVVLAQSAVRRAHSAATATSRALLLERAAWAHAKAGEAKPCERALGQVEDAYADRTPAEDPPWVYWLDADEIEIMAGRCWTELQRPLRAVPILRRATAGYGDDQARETALYLSWLAEAQLQAHEVDEAAATALNALTLSRKTHSARADVRVAVLHERLHRLRGDSAVDEFEDAYHAVNG